MRIRLMPAGQAPLAGLRLLLFALPALVSCAAYRRWPHAPGWTMAALAGIAVAVWHGAYDEVIAEQVLPGRLGTPWRLPFYASYVALAAAMLLVWWCIPALALPAFLLYSAVHFGTEGQAVGSLLALLSGTATGLVPISAACFWWPAQVAAIFTVLLRGDAGLAQHLAQWAGAALLPSLAVSLAGGLNSLQAFAARALLLAVEVTVFFCCTPVVAFALFFCLWHTPEHIVETSLDGLGRCSPRAVVRNLQRGFVPWIVSLAAIGLAALFGRHEVPAYTGLLFLALSALTVPHMLLGVVHQRLCATHTHTPGLIADRRAPCL